MRVPVTKYPHYGASHFQSLVRHHLTSTLSTITTINLQPSSSNYSPSHVIVDKIDALSSSSPPRNHGKPRKAAMAHSRRAAVDNTSPQRNMDSSMATDSTLAVRQPQVAIDVEQPLTESQSTDSTAQASNTPLTPTRTQRFRAELRRITLHFTPSWFSVNMGTASPRSCSTSCRTSLTGLGLYRMSSSG